MWQRNECENEVCELEYYDEKNIMTKKHEGFIDKTYSCVCNKCYNKIVAFINDLQNSSNEGEING